MRRGRLSTWVLAPPAVALLASSLACRPSGQAADASTVQAAPAAPAVKPVTRLGLPERSYEAGDVMRGDTVAHTFTIKNTSTSEVLRIKRAQGT
jgi:hypothetical protein